MPPTWTHTLLELQQALAAAGVACEKKGEDHLVHELKTPRGRTRDVHLRRQPEVLETTCFVPALVAPERAADFDVAMADVNQRLPLCGVRRFEDGSIAYTIRAWLNHDKTIDAQVVVNMVATLRHFVDAYEPALVAAAQGEVGRA